MKYLLHRFDAITEDELNRLSQVAIENTDQLLSRAAFRDQREALACQCNMTENRLLQLAGIADLVRVKGVGIKSSQLFVLAGGVQNVQDLVASAPETLHKVLSLDGGHRVSVRIPSPRQITECIEEASELKARLFIGVPTSTRFQNRLREIAQRNERLMELGQWTGLGVLVTTDAAFLLAWLLRLLATVTNAGNLPPLSRSVLSDTLPFMVQTAVSFSVLLAILVSGSFLPFRPLDQWLDCHVAPRLFDRPRLQEAFLELERGRRDHPPYVWWGVLLLLGGFVGWVLIRLFVLPEPEDPGAFVDVFRVPGYIAFSGAVTIVCLPYLWDMYKRRAGRNPPSIAASQRYLLWRFVAVTKLLISTLLLLHLALPAVLTAHRFVVSHWVVPSFRRRMTTIEQSLSSLPLENHVPSESPERYIEERTQGAIRWALLRDEHGKPVERILLEISGQIIVWLIRWDAVLYCVVPFFLVAKPLRALMYLALIAISYQMERALEDYAPSLFSLPSGSVAAFFIVALLILFNTLFFDWAFQETDEDPSRCPNCGYKTSPSDEFCSSCGSPRLRSGG